VRSVIRSTKRLWFATDFSRKTISQRVETNAEPAQGRGAKQVDWPHASAREAGCPGPRKFGHFFNPVLDDCFQDLPLLAGILVFLPQKPRTATQKKKTAIRSNT